MKTRRILTAVILASPALLLLPLLLLRSVPAGASGAALESRPLSSARTPPPLGPRQRAALLRGFLRRDETPENRDAIDRLIAKMEGGEIDELLAVLNELPRNGKQREHVFTCFMRRWAEIDGAAAFSYGMSARNDPALRKEFHFAAGPAFEAWTGNDLPGAAQALAKIGSNMEEMDARRFAIYLMEAFARKDPQAGMDWVASLGADAPELERQSILSLSRALVTDGRSTLSRQWLQSLSENASSAEAIGWMATRQAAGDPSGAWAWLAALPSEKTARSAIQAMMEDVVDGRQEDLGWWAREFSAGKSFDEAVATYIGMIGVNHPREALAWADLIGDKALRECHRSRIAGSRISSGQGN